MVVVGGASVAVCGASVAVCGASVVVCAIVCGILIMLANSRCQYSIVRSYSVTLLCS